jgi:hypothetical protein
VVILTGVGHAQKGARPPNPFAVAGAGRVMRKPNSIDSQTADVQDTDYLLLEAK